MKNQQLFYKSNYSDYAFKLSEIKEKYKLEILKFNNVSIELLNFYDKDKQIWLIKFQNQLIKNIIKDLLKIFVELKSIPHSVIMHGSFAKNMNRINSDIDLSILYPNEYKKAILPVEELIAIALKDMLDFSGRDKIHTIMVYLKDQNITSSLSSNEWHLKFIDNYLLKYYCRNSSNDLMADILNSPRDCESLSKYILKHALDKKWKEWCFSFYEIEKNNDEFSIYNVVKDCDNIIGSKDFRDKIDKNLEFQITSINFNDLLLNKNIKMSDLNQKIKVRNLGQVYESLAIIRLYLIYNNISLVNIDFFNITNNEFIIKTIGKSSIDDFKDSVLEYMWYLSRIEYFFKQKGYNFSSKSNSVLDVEKMEIEYYKLFGENGFINTINKKTKVMNITTTKILAKIKEKL